MFNWRKIQEMLKLKDFLIQVIERHTEISMEERGNLLGKCDLITSFLMYNDISKMSHFHRSASRQMSRPAISIRNDGGWTFGSPSVLMMFHREPGSLLKEQEEMNECMPHYYKITNGHGQGAERVMDAEAPVYPGVFVRCPDRFGRSLCPDRGKWSGMYGIVLRFSVLAAVVVYEH